MTLYKIPIELEVIADNENDADAYVCMILDMAFTYGLGLCECASQNMESPNDVTRLFDYSFIEEEEE